eukprot:CAMPEP_0115852990 /NCGR_PEP_ID=MMETSP0287-20121206/13277_1 /TAXON_ID=412157 /ORGANISM="Chrysochromulina rotalis, Strain UIO044" /LENGTH=207 /DNA_ID=CAMNT_0003307061 /DNA_START=57 /DNA_END=680 /DNA_ORIENTATION=+
MANHGRVTVPRPRPRHYHGAPQPTDEDRFYFLIFRVCVGGSVLGLTALFTILTLGPIVVEFAFGSPPSPPPEPPSPWTLWSEQDSHASRMILLISGVQALLIGGCFLGYRLCQRRWPHHSYSAAPAQRRRAARDEERDRSRKRKAKRQDARANAEMSAADGTVDPVTIKGTTATVASGADATAHGGAEPQAVVERGRQEHGMQPAQE